MVFGIVEVVFLIVFVISALLLLAVVLLQDEQGEGIGGIFGGGSSSPFGSRSGNVLTRITAILGAVFILTSFGISWIESTGDSEDVIGAARTRMENSAGVVDWWDDTQVDAEQNADETTAK